MKTYTIAKASGENPWANVAALQIDERRKTAYTDVTATAQICYDASALYLRLSAKESEIIATQTGPLGQPSEDSCLEFFFCPMSGDDRYFNFEWNPNGCLFLGLGRNLPTLVRLWPEEERIEDLFTPVISRTADGWMVCFRIPADFVRRFFPDFSLESGKMIRANCYKCGGQSGARHYLTWGKVPDMENFHNPNRFGEMIFE